MNNFMKFEICNFILNIHKKNQLNYCFLCMILLISYVNVNIYSLKY